MKKYSVLKIMLFMLVLAFPMSASAAGSKNPQPFSVGKVKYVNPLYKDVVDESDLKSLPETAVSTCSEDVEEYWIDIWDAAEDMRRQLVTRKDVIKINLFIEEYYDLLYEDLSACAMVHTGVPTEGDYLLWQFAGYDVNINGFYDEEGYYLTFTYVMTYYTTAAQEQKVDAKVDEVLAEMNLTGKSDYQKVKSIYDYICANVTYDYEHLNNKEYFLKNTAYGAMMDGTSVCQGYAVLFYRMALECDIDNRLIAGEAAGGDHGWNIVLLGDRYYNLDTTWDAGRTEYKYFLKSQDNFTDHVRWEEYDTEDFHTYFPMATEDYVEKEEPPVEDSNNPFVDVNKSNYYYDAVLWALDNNITQGKDATHFQPIESCTRAQVVTFLWRSQGCPEPKLAKNPFGDVKTSDYYYKAVLWAYENDITKGKDATHFQPKETVTRNQFVTFLWRAEGKPSPAINNPFEDVQDGTYYTDAVLWAFENDITTGKDATHFQPMAKCQRCQVVTFLYRAYADK